MNANVDLGLALLSVLRKPGVPLTQHDIAAWCDCSPANIYLIEARALRKLRNRIRSGCLDRIDLQKEAA